MEKLQAEITGASSQDKPFLLERRDMLISEHDTGLKQLAIAGALGTSYAAYSGAGLRYVIRQAYGGSMLPHKCETSLTINISK